MSDPRRFLDALNRILAFAQQEIVEQALVIGPGTDDPLVELSSALPNTDITAIDIDPAVVSKLNEQVAAGMIRLVVKEADASQLESDSLREYDLIIVRHPDVAKSTERWRDVFTACARRMREGGVLLISVYALSEIAFVDEVLRQCDMAMLPGSPYTPEPVSLQGNDRYIWAGQK